MRRVLLSFLIVLIVIPGMALAEVISTHYAIQAPAEGPNPSPATDTFSFYNPPELDCFRVGYYSGSFFDVPVLTNFTAAGWAESWGGPVAALAEGPALAGVQFDMNFVDISNGASFLFAGYLGGALQYSSKLTYTPGANWSADAYSWDPGKDRPVPEPATWIALLAGLGVLGVIRLRS